MQIRRLRFIAIALTVMCSCVSSWNSLQAAEVARRWALLVGVDQYTSIENLDYSGNDQRTMASELTKLQFPTDQIWVVHDLAKQKRYLPFRENIERELDLIIKMASPQDILFFSFSGHGVHVDGKSYLCPTEADLNRPVETMIPLDSVFNRMSKCPAAYKIMLIDACRNDPRPRGARGARGDQSISTSFAETLDHPPGGIILLTSCSPGEKSMEDESLQHGVFMHYVLDGLRGKAANTDGIITISSLYDYASLSTKKHVAKRWASQQSPGMKGEISGPFEFARRARAAITSPLIASPSNAVTTVPGDRGKSPITGIWNGKYNYPNNQRAPVGFSMVVIQEGRDLSGFIRESNTFGKVGAPWLHASIRGSYDSNTGVMRFIKTYDGTATIDHDVHYSGNVTQNRIRNGNWQIPNNWGSTFELTKDEGSHDGPYAGVWSGTRYFPEVLGQNPVKFTMVVTQSSDGILGFMKERRVQLDGDDPWYHANASGRIVDDGKGMKLVLTYDGTAHKTSRMDLTGTIGSTDVIEVRGEWNSSDGPKGEFSLNKVPSARW